MDLLEASVPWPSLMDLLEASGSNSGLRGGIPGTFSLKDGQNRSFSFSFPNTTLLRQKILEK